jgi:hypothetical protein
LTVQFDFGGDCFAIAVEDIDWPDAVSIWLEVGYRALVHGLLQAQLDLAA